MKRPKIICHMMSSVDGRLLADRWTHPFDGKDKERMYEPYFAISRGFGAEAWAVGRQTIEADWPMPVFDHSGLSTAEDFSSYMGIRESEMLAVIFDSKGTIAYENCTLDGDNLLIVLGHAVSQKYLEFLREKGISYIFAGPDGRDLTLAIETLHSAFGIKTLLLEGGGVLNGSFLRAGLIDELSLMIYPGIDGLSGMPSIFEAPGSPGELPAQGLSFELTGNETLEDGIIWIYYNIHSK